MAIAQGNDPAIAEREHGIGEIVTLAIPMSGPEEIGSPTKNIYPDAD